MRNASLLCNSFLVVACLVFLSGNAHAATYFVRTDGGTATQCTGLSDAAYPGSGVGLPCAFNHPFWVIAPIGNNPSKMVGGDTLIIDGTNNAQYMVGLGAPNTGDTSKCGPFWPWDCVMRSIPSGPSPTQPTRILGKGFDTGCTNPPQLWGTERAWQVLDLRGSNNVELQCLEITDHSDCQDPGPKACNRSSTPYGAWAGKGIVASDSTNVLIKNVNIHGLAHAGIHAGRLKDWTLDNTQLVANSFVGWDGDIGAGASSNSGTMMFNKTTIAYNGCGETYPGKAPYNCFSQSQGGYGDGLGTHQTSGNWIFTNSDISHNVSDGIDLLYHDGTGTVTIKRTRAEGNAGNQIKSAAGNTVIENSKVIGNCAYFRNNPITWNSGSFDHCRALGNTFSLIYRPGQTVSITNTTVTSNGDSLVMSGGSGCNGSEVLKSRNNIFLGGSDFLGGDSSGLYYASGATGNGDGTCGSLKMDDDYSIIYGTKTIANDCTGKAHSKCQDPKLAEAPVTYYSGNEFNANLQSSSPAIQNGLVVAGVSSMDYNNFDRGLTWDLGALEYGSIPNSSGNEPPPSAICGNGILEAGEQCDGSNLNNKTCTSQGFAGGVLACSNTCTLNTSSCSKCGNGVIDAGEQCDGSNLNSQTCTTQGFTGGSLVCSNICTLNASNCTTNLCGNGVVDPGEQCDGSNLNSQTCTSQGFTAGSLVCSNVCTLNTSNCTTNLCGNGVVDPGEQCDSSNMNNQTCTTQGFTAGTLTCSNTCTLNASNCTTNKCGNGIVDVGEECDGSNFNSQTCTTQGFTGGSLVCSNTCTLNTSNCTKMSCGNGIKEGTEICDDGNLNSNDGCSSTCRAEYCGDGIKQSKEECDDGNWKNRDGCSALCKIERKRSR